jgi:hypothetical protein
MRPEGARQGEIGIEIEKELKYYFSSAIEKAVHAREVELSPYVLIYVTDLMSRFSRTSALFEETDGRFEETPLAFILKRALESTGWERIRLLKRLGDTSLYIAGYLPEYIEKRTVTVGYYISMGEAAYETLSGILSWDPVMEGLYQELAAKFSILTDLLLYIRDVSPGSNTELLRLYERWLKTGEESIRKQLEREGIIPVGLNREMA